MNNDIILNDIQNGLKEIKEKWKTVLIEEYNGNFKKFYRQNAVYIDKDISNLWASVNLQKVSVVKENGDVVALTDLVNKSKNLEVWKALGLQEGDFYK